MTSDKQGATALSRGDYVVATKYSDDNRAFKSVWDYLKIRTLERELAQSREGWQPIETAPKDGTAIIVSNDCGSWVAKYWAIYQSGYKADSPWFSLMLNHDHMPRGGGLPTHWQPLPNPPALKRSRGGAT